MQNIARFVGKATFVNKYKHYNNRGYKSSFVWCPFCVKSRGNIILVLLPTWARVWKKYVTYLKTLRLISATICII